MKLIYKKKYHTHNDNPALNKEFHDTIDWLRLRK